MRNVRYFQVTFATDYFRLVKIVLEPDDWSAFAHYLEDIKILKSSFTHSTLIHIQRTQNIKVDSFVRGAWKKQSFIVLMDAEPPVWLTESYKSL